ncbi:MAG: hypothetical protein ACI35S_01090 [Anaeroplasma sp.]
MAVNAVRTEAELKDKNYNYFIAFGLSVNETNQKTIQDAINKKLGNTGGNPIIDRLIQLKSDILDTMINNTAGKRDKEALNAKNFLLNDCLDVIRSKAAANGIIFESELKELTQSANKTCTYFEFDDLESAFNNQINKSNSIKYVKNAAKSSTLAVFDKLNVFLDQQGKSNLYEFIAPDEQTDVSKASEGDIKKYNEAKKKEGSLKSDRNLKTAYKEICSYVDKLILKDKQTRKEYDQLYKTRDAVWQDLLKRKNLGVNKISINEYSAYAKSLVEILKISVSEAEVLMGNALSTYRISIQGDASDSLKLEICPYEDCKGLYQKGLKVCPNCGRPLEIICWNCSKPMLLSSNNKTCTVCGGHYEKKSDFIKITNKIEQLFSASTIDVVGIQNEISVLKNIVSNYNAVPNSAIEKKVNDYSVRIKKVADEEEALGNSYREDMDKIRKEMLIKNYSRANSMIDALIKKYGHFNYSTSNKLKTEVNEQLKKANNEFDKVDRFIDINKENEAIASAIKALELCADYQEAKQFMSKYPPEAPKNLICKIKDNSYVSVEWSAPNIDSLTTFTIVRKVGSVPNSAKDGVIIEEHLPLTFFADRNITSGIIYYYAIFAERCDIKSSLVQYSTPVSIFKDVTNVNQEIVSDCISVKFDIPEGVKIVEVYKVAGINPPQKRGQGTMITVKKSGFIDTKCNDVNSYLIICCYNINGQDYYSNGLTYTFSKIDDLEDIKKVNIEQKTPTNFIVNTDTKNLKILFSYSKLSCDINKRLLMTDFNVLCKNTKFINLKSAENYHYFNIESDTTGYIYPMISNNQLFILSEPIFINSIVGIYDVGYKLNNDIITIIGKLGKYTTKLLIKVSKKQFAYKLDDDGDLFEVSSKDFKTSNGYSIELSYNTDYYISIIPEINKYGNILYGLVEKLETVIRPISIHLIKNKRKKILKYFTIFLSIFMVLITAFSLFYFLSFKPYTEAQKINTYHIKNKNEFIEMLDNKCLNDIYILDNDINFYGDELKPIGSADNPFKGIFYGNGYTLSNFTINNSKSVTSLFMYNEGTIDSLGVESVNYISDNHTAGFVYCNKGEIINCYVYDVNISSPNNYSTSSGFVSYNEGVIESCYTSIKSLNTNYVFSGFVLDNEESGVINNSFIVMNDQLGEFGIGEFYAINNGKIKNAYTSILEDVNHFDYSDNYINRLDIDISSQSFFETIGWSSLIWEIDNYHIILKKEKNV